MAECIGLRLSEHYCGMVLGLDGVASHEAIPRLQTAYDGFPGPCEIGFEC